MKIEKLISADFEQRITKPKILLFDIETAPNLAYVWAHYEQNVLSHVRERYVLSFAAKWLGEKEIIVKALPDYKGYKPHTDCDASLMKDLWDLFDQADVIVGHNLDRFDIKRSNARFIKHGLGPPQTYKTIDTRKQARKHFDFNSNKLDDLGNFLGVGRKVKHTGFDLWLQCMAGDEAGWKVMRKYNKQDVLLLERVYLELRPWMEAHPNLNVIMNRETGCPKCGSKKIYQRGYRPTNTGRTPRFKCEDCGGWGTGRHQKIAEVR